MGMDFWFSIDDNGDDDDDAMVDYGWMVDRICEVKFPSLDYASLFYMSGMEAFLMFKLGRSARGRSCVKSVCD